MIEVDPNRRITLQEVFRHPWVSGSSKSEPELELPMAQVVEVRFNYIYIVKKIKQALKIILFNIITKL